jgi:very-short-patch-repair endonuclease
VSALGASNLGVFCGVEAVRLGVTRNQLTALVRAGVITRELPDTYRMTAVARSNDQRLRAALLWAGKDAAAAGRSAGENFGLEGIRAPIPEVAVRRSSRMRHPDVIVHRGRDREALMVRRHRGILTAGPEQTLVALAASLEGEAFEIACEDARRRRLTTVPALESYLRRFGRAGRPGVGAMRELLRELDPKRPSRSTLEVKTRRLLASSGMTGFTREFPLDWCGRTYLFDFAFEREHTVLETNGRRWHDDAVDYERDNEKWSVPGRHGWRIVFATWSKVTEHPRQLLDELAITMAA